MAPKGNKNAVGNNGGRPTEYKPEYCEEVRKLCLLGLTDIEIAQYLGVSKSTLNNWKKEHTEFLASLKDGKEGADTKVADSLYKKALGGDTTAMIFWLKNRRKMSWRDKQDIDVNGNITVNLVNYANSTDTK